MTETFRVTKVGTGMIVTGLIRERTLQHEDLFTQRMGVLGKARAGLVLDDTGGVTALGLVSGPLLALFVLGLFTTVANKVVRSLLIH